MRGMDPPYPAPAEPASGLGSVPGILLFSTPFSNRSRPGAYYSPQLGALFRRNRGDETNLRADETRFHARENDLKRRVAITWLTNGGAEKAPDSGDRHD